MNLFKEKTEYDSLIRKNKPLRKHTYIITMLLMDDAYEDLFKGDIQKALKCSEKNFFKEYFEKLKYIFPRSEKVFHSYKFIS